MSYTFYAKIDYSIILKNVMEKYKIPEKLCVYRGVNAGKHFMNYDRYLKTKFFIFIK